jgi:hypothetical protein
VASARAKLCSVAFPTFWHKLSQPRFMAFLAELVAHSGHIPPAAIQQQGLAGKLLQGKYTFSMLFASAHRNRKWPERIQRIYVRNDTIFYPVAEKNNIHNPAFFLPDTLIFNPTYL